jgi:hypothetical protein
MRGKTEQLTDKERRETRDRERKKRETIEKQFMLKKQKSLQVLASQTLMMEPCDALNLALRLFQKRLDIEGESSPTSRECLKLFIFIAETIAQGQELTLETRQDLSRLTSKEIERERQ